MIWLHYFIEVFGCRAMESRIYAQLVEWEAFDLIPKVAVIIDNFRGLEMHIPIEKLNIMPIPELHEEVLKIRELPPNEFRQLDIFIDSLTSLECFKIEVKTKAKNCAIWNPLTQRFRDYYIKDIVEIEIRNEPSVSSSYVDKWLSAK